MNLGVLLLGGIDGFLVFVPHVGDLLVGDGKFADFIDEGIKLVSYFFNDQWLFELGSDPLRLL